MKAQLPGRGEQKWKQEGSEPSNDTNLNDRFSRRRNDAAPKGSRSESPALTQMRSNLSAGMQLVPGFLHPAI